MSSAAEIISRIEDDPVFRGFLEPEFDAIGFASNIVSADVSKQAQLGGDSGVINGAVHGTSPITTHSEGLIASVVDRKASADTVSSQAEITLDSMSAHIARIESAIRSHILHNEEDFLGSVGGVSELSRRTEEFRNGVRELRRSFSRVRREVSEPHEAIRLRTQQLNNLHSATRLLKRTLRVLAALRRLRRQEEALGLDENGLSSTGSGGGGMTDLTELAKAAQSLQVVFGYAHRERQPGRLGLVPSKVSSMDLGRILPNASRGINIDGEGNHREAGTALLDSLQALLPPGMGNELEGMLRDPEVAEVDIVGEERPYVEAYGATVRRMAADYLGRGLKSLNQTDVGGALQVFFNLGCLPARVKTCITHLTDEAVAAVAATLHPTALAEATSATGSSPTGTISEPPGGASGSGAPVGSSGVGGGVSGARAPPTREAGATVARRRAARMRAHAAKLASSLHSTSMEAWGLQRVLDKKRDPTTRVLLDMVVRINREAGLSNGAYHGYWDGFCHAARGAVERALVEDGVDLDGGGGGNIAAGAALVAMYPCLRKALQHLMKRLREGTRGTQSSGRSDSVDNTGITPVVWKFAGKDSMGTGGVSSWLRSDRAFSGGAVSGSAGILGGSRWLSIALDEEFGALEGEEAGLHGVTQGWALRSAERDAVVGLEADPGVNSSLLRREGLKKGSERSGTQREEGVGRLGTNGTDGSEGDKLLEALGPLRDLFLTRSLERLTTPVEQMFPQYDGYMAAVPSKHDLASFVRAIHTELALALPAGGRGGLTEGLGGAVESGGAGYEEADLSLAYLLLRGVVSAVKLLCAKVEVMHNVEKAAFAFGAGAGVSAGSGSVSVGGIGTADENPAGMGTGSGGAGPGTSGSHVPNNAWAPSAEQEHNLQLLELVVKLRSALLGIPAMLTSERGVGDGDTGMMAGGGGERPDTSWQVLVSCKQQVDDAVSALDGTAADVILNPYLSGIARALEEIMSRMHRENFGSEATSASGGSYFLGELQVALAALQSDHLNRIFALHAPCVQESLKSLAARLLRSYVTHCALLRPLSESGKTRVAQDMATLEIALSPLARVAELGPVYDESKAFRTLLFVDDHDSGERDARSFMTEACMANLRPSSVWHYLFSGAPDELTSPHVCRGMSEQAYVTWLLGGGAAAEAKAKEEASAAKAGGGTGSEACAKGTRVDASCDRSTLSSDTSYMAESGAWAVVQECLDLYHERRSATRGYFSLSSEKLGGDRTGVLPRSVSLLPEAGPALLSAYEARVGFMG